MTKNLLSRGPEILPSLIPVHGEQDITPTWDRRARGGEEGR